MYHDFGDLSHFKHWKGLNFGCSYGDIPIAINNYINQKVTLESLILA